MAVAYMCTDRHRWEITPSVDQTLSHTSTPIRCPKCDQPMERVATNKHNNRIVYADGYRFQSQHEANYYEVLKLRQRAGEIRNLQIHPSWVLVVNGVRIGKYTADFSFEECTTGQLVVIDTKSHPTLTEAYQLRKKLMLACHGIHITEVFND